MMVASSDVINAAGRLSELSLGSEIIADWSSAGIVILQCIMPSFILLV